MSYLQIQEYVLGQVLDFLHELIYQGMIYIFSCRGDKNSVRLFLYLYEQHDFQDPEFTNVLREIKMNYMFI